MKRKNILKTAIISTVLGTVILAAGCNNEKTEETTATAETTSEETESEAEETAAEESTEAESNSEADIIGMENPFVDCSSMAEAVEIAGFEMECPTFDDMGDKEYQAIKGQLIQVFNRGLGGGKDGYILVRKGIITEDMTAEDGVIDISGDYNDYSVEKKITIGETEVTVKGNEEDSYSVVIWNDDEYAYSIFLNAVTLPENVIDAYVPLIK